MVTSRKTAQQKESPIKKIRQELGLSMYRLAAEAGSNDGTIQKLQVGAAHAIPKKLLSFFQAHGYDPDELERQYAEYRRQLQSL